MPTNLERKARISDLQCAIGAARCLGAEFVDVLHQKDTYFQVQAGRLKLREIVGHQSELIYYERDENSFDRISHFQIYPVAEPSLLISILSKAIGIKAIVEKERSLFLH